jgi:hypothetical protein
MAPLSARTLADTVVCVASIYISYRSTEEPFAEKLASRLEQLGHQIRIDLAIPVGAVWRTYQLAELRDCEVFLVLVSKETRASDFQNAEMGGANIWSTFVDQKQILPVLVDDVDPPRPLADRDCLKMLHRDVDLTAIEIDRAIGSRQPRVRLFVSHAHRDADLASPLVDFIAESLQVPNGELRCTSVPGYQLDLGVQAGDKLKLELGATACVIALLTPNSLNNDWVLFELGAAWSNTKTIIPLLAGGLENKDLPAALRGAVGGQLNSPAVLDLVLDQLQRVLGWKSRIGLKSRSMGYQLVEYVGSRKSTADPVAAELQSSFTAKHARIGAQQSRILDRVRTRSHGKPYVHIDELADDVAVNRNELYYRLEQLRLFGFLARIELGESSGTPTFGWTLSDKYRKEIS